MGFCGYQNRVYTKYVNNGTHVVQETYSSSNCTGTPHIENPVKIGSSCEEDPVDGVTYEIITVGTAPYIEISPTELPTTIPSIAPTVPTQNPITYAPTVQTNSPTISPTHIPTTPTNSPTHSTNISCGDDLNEWCYYVDLYPMNGQSISEIVAVADTSDDESYLHIIFTAKGSECISPTIDVIFEEIDFSSDDEYIKILDNNANSITNCTGSLIEIVDIGFNV